MTKYIYSGISTIVVCMYLFWRIFQQKTASLKSNTVCLHSRSASELMISPQIVTDNIIVYVPKILNGFTFPIKGRSEETFESCLESAPELHIFQPRPIYMCSSGTGVTGLLDMLWLEIKTGQSPSFTTIMNPSDEIQLMYLQLYNRSKSFGE